MTAPHSSQGSAMAETRTPQGSATGSTKAEYASASSMFFAPCFDMENSSLMSGQTAVFDMSGIRYILITPPWKIKEDEKESNKIPLRPLAQGGQGITYLTTNPNVILKFAKKVGKLIPASSEGDFSDFHARISYVTSLAFPQGINITLPETLLRDYAGYRMPFLGGMVSLEDFFFGRQLVGERPSNLPEGKGYDRIWRYLLSGGLKQRLNTAGRLSILLSKLHLHGISYGDISQNNIFIPEDIEKPEIYLIDPDNLVENGDRHSVNIGTPPFRAPEICEGECCTIFSDVFAFAMLVFNLICDCHPFQGKAYKDSDLFYEEKENPREFAWILDPQDTSNQRKTFLPQGELLSNELLTLFWMTFTEGKDSPAERPPLQLWPEYIFKEYDDLRLCSDCSCKMSLLPSKRSECPICGKKYDGEMECSFFASHGNQLVWRNRFAFSSLIQHCQVLCKRSWMPFDLDSHDVPQIEIRLNEGLVSFQKTSLASGKFWYSLAEYPEKELTEGAISFKLEDVPNLSIRHEEQGIVRNMRCRLLSGGIYNG